jgi:hypothetical protein
LCPESRRSRPGFCESLGTPPWTISATAAPCLPTSSWAGGSQRRGRIPIPSFATATVAVVGLTATVVILATDETDKSATDRSASSARQASALSAQEKKWRAFTDAINSMTPTERAHAFSAQSVAPGARYDGGPEEGSPDVTPAKPCPAQAQAFPGLSREAQPPAGTRYDNGPEEGTRGPRFGTD